MWEIFGRPDSPPVAALKGQHHSDCFSVILTIFPGGSGLAGTRMSPFRVLWKLRMMELVVTADGVQSSSQIITTNKPTCNFLQAGCPSWRPTNSLKALNGKKGWVGEWIFSTSLHFNSHFSRWTWVSQFYYIAQLREVVVTTGAIRRARLQSNRHHQQTNMQLFTGRMPFLRAYRYKACKPDMCRLNW